MKLIYCKKCKDIIKLNFYKRKCLCESSWGYYEPDGLHATIGGSAVPIGIDNLSFAKAVSDEKKYPSYSLGYLITAFVIPASSDRITRE